MQTFPSCYISYLELHERGMGRGCSSVARASDRHAAEVGSVSSVAVRDFSSRVHFQCRLSYGVRTALVCNRMHSHLCAP